MIAESQRKYAKRNVPSPLMGEGQDGGVLPRDLDVAPPPYPSPVNGEGIRSVMTHGRI